MSKSPLPELVQRHSRLAERLHELESRMQGIEAELDSHHDPDWSELATEREGDEVLERMGQSAQAEVRMIRAALQRIEAGDYGTCVDCGADIGAARLDVLPFTPFCRSCADTHRKGRMD